MSTTKATSENAVATEEDYEFAPIENTGKVNVANHTHDDEREHTYTVTVENGQATHCSCPGHGYGATTKHRDAVEGNADVLAVADPGRCSNGHDFCPGPAAIDVERGPEVGDDFACFECWMDACRTNEEGDR
jgi:hypothetical protein